MLPIQLFSITWARQSPTSNGPDRVETHRDRFHVLSTCHLPSSDLPWEGRRRPVSIISTRSFFGETEKTVGPPIATSPLRDRARHLLQKKPDSAIGSLRELKSLGKVHSPPILSSRAIVKSNAMLHICCYLYLSVEADA